MPIGLYGPDELSEIRMLLSWQPLFGSSLRIGYFETLDLTVEEAEKLLKWMGTQRRAEWKAVFGG